MEGVASSHAPEQTCAEISLLMMNLMVLIKIMVIMVIMAMAMAMATAMMTQRG